MTESKIQAEVRAILSHPNAPTRVWRNNVGQDRVTHVRYGLGVGSADLIGLYRRLITQEDVGSYIAQFMGIEIKTPIGRLSKEQKAWLKTITELGGIAKVCRSAQEATAFLETL